MEGVVREWDESAGAVGEAFAVEFVNSSESESTGSVNSRWQGRVLPSGQGLQLVWKQAAPGLLQNRYTS